MKRKGITDKKKEEMVLKNVMNIYLYEKCVLEPCAVKVARTVLMGGKLAKAYLSESQGFATLKNFV